MGLLKFAALFAAVYYIVKSVGSGSVPGSPTVPSTPSGGKSAPKTPPAPATDTTHYQTPEEQGRAAAEEAIRKTKEAMPWM